MDAITSNLGLHSMSSGSASDFNGMRRGAAAATLAMLAERNSYATSLKRFALSRLRERVSGEESQSNVQDDPVTLRFSRSQLRLLRQEQLMLMSENERLVHELHELRRSRSAKAFRPTQPRSVPEFRESKLSRAIDSTLSGERDLRFNATRIALLCGLISRLRLRLLSTVMRVLARQPIKSLVFSGPRAFSAMQPNLRQTTAACLIMETIIRSKVHRTKRFVFRMLTNAGSGRSTPSVRLMIHQALLPPATSREDRVGVRITAII
ncbi:hypothetical protein X943_004081 [Babesia divergens]|uniref:Uncharacterized protein n=1 Tax=Babesia divergens TaxID=32595 RepID=A0AAD9G9M6_BABDI|nr:hypothetical protein X943_004081 [Babesia divergens]